MSPLRALRLLTILVCTLSSAVHAQSVLFVGNSFTFVPRDVGIGTATELNKNKAGGVPALFQALAVAGGKNPAVTMETVGGKPSSFTTKPKRS